MLLKKGKCRTFHVVSQAGLAITAERHLVSLNLPDYMERLYQTSSYQSGRLPSVDF